MASRRWLGVLALFMLAIVAGAERCWWLAAAVALLLVLFQSRQPLWRREAIVALLIFAGGFVYALADFATPEEPERDGETVTLTGTVLTYPQSFENRVSFRFAPEEPGSAALELVQVNIYDEIKIGRGDRLRLEGELVRPAPPGNPGQFDYRAYLEHQGIRYCLRVDSRDEAQILAAGRGLSGAMSRFRQQFSAYAEEKLTGPEAAVLLGMVLGQREAIDAERYAGFQQSGVVHLFSVSGLHVGFLMLLVGWLTGLGRLRAGARLALSLAALFLYAGLVGWPVPVTRATLMASLLMIAYYTGRQGQSLNVLALAGLIILLLDPHALYTVSFQLSFVATAGLVWLFPLLRGALPRQSRWIDALLIPLCAQLATLPLIISNFHLFSPVSLPANLLVTWLAAGAVMCGFLAGVFFAWAPALAELFIYPAGMLTEIIMRLVEVLLRLPGAYWMAAAVSPALVASYYLGLIILGLRWQRLARERQQTAVRAEYEIEAEEAAKEAAEEAEFAAAFAEYLAAAVEDTEDAEPASPPPRRREAVWLIQLRRHSAVLALLLMSLLLAQAFYPAAWRDRGALEVVFIDVGQGDAILIKSPQGKFILVDGGGSQVYDVGERVVLPYLYQRGIRKLDMMISSHPDFDHTDGLHRVAAALPVNVAGLGAVSIDADEYAELKAVWAQQETALLPLQKGDVLLVEPGVTIEVLHPQSSRAYSDAGDNNDSLVLALRWQDFSLLLTGDAEQPAQQALLRDGGPGPFAAVKVPHHGSRSALTEGFYERLQPQLAVISVGEGNRYGHPHAEVLTALEQQGARILRTDRDGAVRLLTNGEWLQAEGYREQK